MSIEKALGKLRAAQMCHPNAVQALIDEAIAAIQQAEAQQPATGEPVASRNPFASRCYAMSESHLSGHRLIVGFEKLGDAQDAYEWVTRQGRGDFTHPATDEPVGYMNEGHIHELAMGRLPYGYVYPEAGAGASTAVYTHTAPSVPDDHQIAALVNKVRDIARMFHDHQSLRERIAIELVPALKASQEVKSNAERWRYAIADGGNQSMNFIDIFDDWDGDGSFVEAFDKARLADKKEGSAA